MLSINLEKKLIKQNKKLVTPKELLFLNEYDKFTTLAENDVLKRIGINKTLEKGKNIKLKINEKLEDTKKFNKERVFHISQIKSICMKYYLRFLPITRYNGIIDDKLPTKITNFEIAYNIKCNKENLMIMAPMKSFDLDKKPVDPLMFYQINDDYFYLIHKWGNDLNIFRRFKSLLSNMYISSILFCLIPLPLLLIYITLYIPITLAFIFFTLLFNGASYVSNDDDRIRFYKTNKNWRKTYK